MYIGLAGQTTLMSESVTDITGYTMYSTLWVYTKGFGVKTGKNVIAYWLFEQYLMKISHWALFHFLIF